MRAKRSNHEVRSNWHLLKLFRELQAGELSAALVAAALSHDELSRLIQAFLFLPQQDGENERSDLMVTIEAYAGQATDTERYYGQVIERLVLNQGIDFEAIISEDLPSDALKSHDEAVRDLTHTDREPESFVESQEEQSSPAVFEAPIAEDLSPDEASAQESKDRAEV